MTLVVQTDQGLENANSYCDAAFADEHLTLSGDLDIWSALELDDKKRFLITATFFADDMFEWRGTPVLDYPGLNFPMTGLYDKYGRLITGVPRILKEGVAELAFYFANNDPFADNDLSGIAELSIDVLRVKFTNSSDTASRFPMSVMLKLSSLGVSNLGRRRSARVVAI